MPAAAPTTATPTPPHVPKSKKRNQTCCVSCYRVFTVFLAVTLFAICIGQLYIAGTVLVYNTSENTKNGELDFSFIPGSEKEMSRGSRRNFPLTPASGGVYRDIIFAIAAAAITLVCTVIMMVLMAMTGYMGSTVQKRTGGILSARDKPVGQHNKEATSYHVSQLDQQAALLKIEAGEDKNEAGSTTKATIATSLNDESHPAFAADDEDDTASTTTAQPRKALTITLCLLCALVFLLTLASMIHIYVYNVTDQDYDLRKQPDPAYPDYQFALSLSRPVSMTDYTCALAYDPIAQHPLAYGSRQEMIDMSNNLTANQGYHRTLVQIGEVKKMCNMGLRDLAIVNIVAFALAGALAVLLGCVCGCGCWRWGYHVVSSIR